MCEADLVNLHASDGTTLNGFADEIECAAGHTSAARLLPRMAAIHERHAGTAARKAFGGAGPGRSCADDDNVEGVHGWLLVEL